jgi:hypothetical protein
MNARDAAYALRAWAQENNLFKTEFPMDLNLEEEEKDNLFDSLAISHQAESIFRQRGITGIALNNATSEVIVFTEKVVPIKAQKMLPQAFLEDVSVRYIHSGLPQAGLLPPAGTPAPYIMRNQRFACGGSIHPAKVIGAGTMGCLVRDANGTLFGLTNNHVSGMCNYANNGEKILAPGHIDITAGGINPFTVGYHTRALPMVQGLPDNVDISTNNDAALVQIADENLVTSYQGVSYDTPVRSFDLLPAQQVEKVGRTTGHTRGVVVGQVIGPHPVRYMTSGYGEHVSFFDPVFAIQGLNSEPFSLPGDSGSLVTIQQNGSASRLG